MATFQHSLSSLAGLLGLSFQGADADLLITGVNTLEEAGPTELSFLANPRYARQLKNTRAAAVIVRADHAGQVKNALISADPYTDFARSISLFAKAQGSFRGVSPLASIHPDAVLGENCTVYPFAYIGPRATLGDTCVVFPGCYIGEDCELGAGCTLYPNAVLMAGTVLGKGCVLQPGAVIGAEGFGFARTPLGIYKIPQIGNVVLGDRVEVGVNSAIDRAALSETRVGKGTCIDNLVQVGHNVRIGEECMLVSQVGISGSTKVGNRVTMAGQVGVAGHLSIGDNVTIGPQSGVAKDIAPDQVVGGSPAVDQRTFMRTLARMPQFPDLFTRLTKVEKALAALDLPGFTANDAEGKEGTSHE